MEELFWQQQLSQRSPAALAALVTEALRTRTYLVGHAPSRTDAAVLAALAAAPLSHPRLTRWSSTCAAAAAATTAPTAAAAASPLEARVARLEAQCSTVQSNFPAGSCPSPEVARVQAALQALPGSALLRVPAGYYALQLRERARLLQAPVAALCKTLVLENAGGSAVGDPGAPLSQQRYLAVIVQYTARLNLAALGKVVGAAAPLTLAGNGTALTGFGHNGVTSLGSLTPLPVVLARDAMQCGCPFIYLGGGQEDVKARVFLAPLAAQPGVHVLPISDARPEEEWES